VVPSYSSRIVKSALQSLGRLAICVFCATVCLTTATGVHGADGDRVKRVLMISTEGRFTPGIVLAEQGVQDVLLKRSPSRIEFYAEYLDASRFPDESHHRLFREYLRDKYRQNPPDLVMLFYTRNFYLAGKLPAELFGQVPVVAAGLSEEEIPVGRLGAFEGDKFAQALCRWRYAAAAEIGNRRAALPQGGCQPNLKRGRLLK